MADQQGPAPGVRNDLSGHTGAAIQAGAVQGGVHVTVGGSGGWNAPRQLPLSVAGFVNRKRELAQMDGLLARIGDSERHTPNGPIVISAVTGAAGVGKTALALHWAHRVRHAFPDGDLYVDLRGYDLRVRVTAEQALDGFLHALNVPVGRIPVEIGARAALFRTLLDGKRMLVILDNAAAADQLRPLLPGTGKCLVLVTSRSRLSGFVAREGAKRMTIEYLDPDESLALLAEIVGSERVDAEPEAARRLALLCDGLPLALRIVAERILTQSYNCLSDFVHELSDEQERLDALELDEDELTAVRTVFSWSYRALAPDAARTFRLLGLGPTPEFSVSSVAALLGLDQRVAARLLRELGALHLVQQSDAEHFRIHDLLRSYARERLYDEEPGGERDAALDRVLAWYLHTAHAASCRILPQGRRLELVPLPEGVPGASFADADAALAWCERERVALVDAVKLADSLGRDRVAWQLPVALLGFLEIRSYRDDWIATHRVALRAARRLGDGFGEAWVALGLADAYWESARGDEALDTYRQALALARATGDRWGEGFALRGISLVLLDREEFRGAIEYSSAALLVFEEIGERRGVGMCHLSIGQGHQGLGQVVQAAARYDLALTVFRALGNEWSVALATFRRGAALRELARADEAEACHLEAAAGFGRLGDREHQATVLESLGDLHRERGAALAALAAWRQAQSLFGALDDERAGAIADKIGGGAR